MAGHHESREQRHFKERMAVWLFIGGDLVFLLMELFFWFYLRALNTNGMWRGAACSKANPCTDGLGNPITSEITKANPAYTLTIAGLTVIAALLIWRVEVASRRRPSAESSAASAALGLLFLLAAVAMQCIQFGKLPFTTIDGSYASSFIFFMGSTLGHLLLSASGFAGLGPGPRAGQVRPWTLVPGQVQSGSSPCWIASRRA